MRLIGASSVKDLKPEMVSLFDEFLSALLTICAGRTCGLAAFAAREALIEACALAPDSSGRELCSEGFQIGHVYRVSSSFGGGPC